MIIPEHPTEDGRWNVPAPLRADVMEFRPRQRAWWGVFDHKGNQIAQFPFKDKVSAEQRITELMSARKFPDETFFLQLVKERM